MSDWYDYDEDKNYWDDQEDEDDWSDYEPYDEDVEDRPLTLTERFDQWFSRTRIGRLYWRVRSAWRNRSFDPNDIPF